MKKTILTLASALLMLTGYAQQQFQEVIDLNTGRVNGNPWGYIAAGSADDTWKVKVPGNGGWVNAYATTGHIPGYMLVDGYIRGSYQDIDWTQGQPLVNQAHDVIAPYICGYNHGGDPANPISNVGDIQEFTSNEDGVYTYRMQFPFNLSCNNITSANLNIRVLSGAGITGFRLNGQIFSLPAYSTWGNNCPDFYDINQAKANAAYVDGQTNNNYYPIPYQSINIPKQYFIDGINSFYFTLDNRSFLGTGKRSAALIVKAELEINYTKVGALNNYINLLGSTSSMVSGNQGLINVDLSGAVAQGLVPNFSGYFLSLSPGNSFVQLNNNQTSHQFLISPTSVTNYVVTLTSPDYACSSSKSRVVMVSSLPTPGFNNPPSSRHICEGGTGVLNIDIPDPHKYLVSVDEHYEEVEGAPVRIFEGYLTAGEAIEVRPSSPLLRGYNVTLTDSAGNTATTVWQVDILPQPCDDALGKQSVTTGINKASYADVMSISPNPSQGLFTLNVKAAKGSLSVYDVSGKIVKKISIVNETTSYNVDLTGFSKGIYMLRGDLNGKNVFTKLVVE